LGVLQCICKRCSRVLLTYEDRNSYLKKAKSPHLDALAKAALFKRIMELCKRASTCPHCGYANGKK
jgi:DNA-directed RNA polymerase III subunit RPC1